jgi:hypothetical protein
MIKLYFRRGWLPFRRSLDQTLLAVIRKVFCIYTGSTIRVENPTESVFIPSITFRTFVLILLSFLQLSFPVLGAFRKIVKKE